MLFSRDKDDDDDFVPNSNYHSNLASIFGRSGDDGNSNLTYTPPKQPKRHGKSIIPSSIPSSSMTTSSSSNVIIAKVVQTFKMVDGSYKNEGRMGVAIVSFGSEGSRMYQLLLYRNKHNHLSSTKITKEFDFHIQPKNYCTFYDKNSLIWSILFENSSEMVAFNIQMAITKWKVAEKAPPLISHNLWFPHIDDPKSSAATLGDSIELACSLHSISNISEALENELTTSVTVESEGWKAALVGMLPGGKRAIIMLPNMLDGEIYPKKTSYSLPVLLKVEALKIIKNHLDKPAGHRNELIVTQEEDEVRSEKVEQGEENPVSNPKPTKADLITRMARMGQALPFKKSAPTPSDSDETEDDQLARSQYENCAAPKDKSRVQLVPLRCSSSFTTPLSTSATITAVPWAQPTNMINNMYIPSNSQLQSPGVDSQSQFHIFLSEMRTTNSELRMGINRLMDKVEALQTKVENTSKSSLGSSDFSALMEKMLENEKQTHLIVSALNNTQLVRPSSPTNDTSFPPNSNILETSQPCQKCASQEQSFNSLNNQVKDLQEQMEYLKTTNSAHKDAIQNAKIADKNQIERIKVLEKQLEEDQKRISELNKMLDAVQVEKDKVAGDLMAATTSVSELQLTLQEKQMNIDRLEHALQESEATKLEEVRRNLQEVLDPKPFIGDHLKKILNVVYRLVKLQFEPQKQYDAIYIQSILAETIKGVTLEYLENGNLLLSERTQERSMIQKLPLQTQSDPTVTSLQNKDDESNNHLMRSSVKVETNLTAISTEVQSDLEAIVPDQDSTDSLYADSVTTQDTTEEAASVNHEVEPIQEVSKSNSIVASTDSSSDDDRSVVSEKLQTVLIHLSSSQTKLTSSHPSTIPLHRSLFSSWQKHQD